MRHEPGLWLGHGQCIEQYGAGEAYLPVLEALGRLCRGPDGERLVALLTAAGAELAGAAAWPARRQRAEPTCSTRWWAPRGRACCGSWPRRWSALSAEQPLVLVLEDLHWSDPSTLEALAMLARRREPARLLVLGTYRPAEVVVRDHPLQTVKQELLRQGARWKWR